MPTPTPWKLDLVERRRDHMGHKPDFNLILNGKHAGIISYNMRGYIGYLPTPEGAKLDIGEVGISRYRAEIARLNRDARRMVTS